MFILGNESHKTGLKSLATLKSHVLSSKGPDHDDIIHLVLNITITLLKEKDYTPRIIPLRHHLHELGEQSVLLVTKDPAATYRTILTEKDAPTEDDFNDIISLGKVKAQLRNLKKMLALYKENDIVVADHRVHKRLPEAMGAQFYEKNRKVPLMIQMAKPDPFAELTKVHKSGSKSGRLKDERCDPKYVKKQLLAIVNNTSFIPNVGNTISIKVGRTSWSGEDILDNVETVIEWLVSEKFKPVGGLLRSKENIKSAHLKTTESISLVLMEKKAEKEEEEDDNGSDFDF